MKKVFLSVFILFLAVGANAFCLKCDQSTGYWCFISTFGTKAKCDNPTGAGCFTWGSCSSGASCDYGCVENIAALPFTDYMKVASVSVMVPQRS